MEPAPRFVVAKEPAPSLRGLSWSSARPRAGPGLHKCFLARNGIYHGIGALGLVPGDRVLVPAYICRAAVDPILARGIDVDYYRIGPRCQVDLDDVASRIGPRTRTLLVVHYFGFPQDMAAITALCRARRLYVIEDCAHVFGGTPGLELGTHGDIGVFSWRKFLPLYDGSDLLINADVRFSPLWQRESPLFTLKVAKNLFDRWGAERWWFASIDKWLGIVKRSLLARSGSSASAVALGADTGSLDFDPRFVDFPMSRLSRWMLAHGRAEWIVARRRENYRRLGDLLGSAAAVQSMFPDLPGSVCPWIYPVFVGARPDAHLRLRARGIPAVTWGGVRPPGLPASDHAGAVHFYDNLVFLPVHQGLETHAIETIAAAVRAVAEDRSKP